MIKATLRGVATIVVLLAVIMPANSAFLGAAKIDHLASANSSVTGLAPVIKVQNNGQGQLVPPSVAGRNAKRCSGGKLLGIRLRGGANPVYIVKVKKGGTVRRLRVNARNGNVLGC